MFHLRETLVAEDEMHLRGGQFYPVVMQALRLYNMSSSGNVTY